MPATQWFDLPSPFAMKRGGALQHGQLAYETWGTLDPARGNAILIVTGLSPSAHAASSEADPESGWWEGMIGAGKAIDTDRFHVICVNTLGSPKGSSSPASIDAATGLPYRLAFPALSIEDCADAAAALVRGLGIERLACVLGCSMGGMVALALLHRHAGIARGHVNVSGAAHALPFSIAIRSLQREAIRLDPAWNEGNYDADHYPENGMRIARKLGVITYRSALEWDGRFGRVRLDGNDRAGDSFGHEFQVESYLEGHAQRFVRQFDPNCYLYLSRSMDWFDLGEYADGDVVKALASIRVDHALAIGVTTDILFPLQQQEQIADGLRDGGAASELVALRSPQGHDAFLVDLAGFGPPIARLLGSL